MRVPAPADKRFRRAHVSPARRRPARDRWRKAARLAVFCAVAGGGAYYLANAVRQAELLTVSDIEVDGNDRISRGEVLALLEGMQGASMLTVDIEAWRRKLLDSPWVADAAIRRVFPRTVSVVVSERRPMAIGRIGGALYLVDATGVIIDQFGPNYADIDLPIIDGLAARKPGSALVDVSRAALAARLLGDLRRRPDLARRISQIDVSDARDAAVIFERDTALVRIGDDRFVERLQSYLDLAPALRERIPSIDYVDLRFEERVYVRPHSTAPSRGRKGAGG